MGIMKKKNPTMKLKKIIQDKPNVDKRLIGLKKSIDEVNKILNGKW